MIGYPSRQDGAILPTRDCPFCSCNNISPKSKWVHKSFLLQNTFCGSRKIFCDFSVRMEQKNEKTEMHYHFAYNWLPFQCSKINKYKDHFSVLFTLHTKSFIDQASSVKMAGYWPPSLFAFLWTSTLSQSIRTQKENSANIQPS